MIQSFPCLIAAFQGRVMWPECQSCMFVSAGHEFCKELRKTVPDSVVPIIMLSAKNSEENIVKGLQQGCNDFCRYHLLPWHAVLAVPEEVFIRSIQSWTGNDLRLQSALPIAAAIRWREVF